MQEKISFNKPHMTGKELFYIAQANFNYALAGDGLYTKKCHDFLQSLCNCKRALLTHSCTAALEMQSLLLNIQAGDEVIMPSYTFVSTANAVVLRGGIPVFIDIREDTLNINEQLIEAAITNRTKAIAPVHYAGVSCDMDVVMDIANKHNLKVIEDAAQGFMSTYKGKHLGTIGDLGALSFHETKNIISGEGGALLINDENFISRAEIIREKGTDRSRFFRGEIDKYTWQDIGSSYLPGELISAFLWAQLEECNEITENRLMAWNNYNLMLKDLEHHEYIRRPTIPQYCSHNGHMYYIILKEGIDRQKIIQGLKQHGIHAVFHYLPLHLSPAGRKYCKINSDMKITENLSQRIIRLPLWYGITVGMQEKIVNTLAHLIKNE